VYKNKVFLLFTIENVGFYGNQLLELKIGSGVVPVKVHPLGNRCSSLALLQKRDSQTPIFCVGVAVACAVGAACYLALSAPDEKVEGTLSCSCGKVKGKFTAAKSAPITACHCEDCIGFVKWAREARNCPVDVSRCSMITGCCTAYSKFCTAYSC
jgi:hypothetical protein